MTFDVSDVMDLYGLVKSWRKANADRFPMPSFDDSVRFAFTEAGELVDAVLRMNPKYSRNHDTVRDVFREAADLVFMLLTACLYIEEVENVENDFKKYVKDVADSWIIREKYSEENLDKEGYLADPAMLVDLIAAQMGKAYDQFVTWRSYPVQKSLFITHSLSILWLVSYLWHEDDENTLYSEVRDRLLRIEDRLKHD